MSELPVASCELPARTAAAYWQLATNNWQLLLLRLDLRAVRELAVLDFEDDDCLFRVVKFVDARGAAGPWQILRRGEPVADLLAVRLARLFDRGGHDLHRIVREDRHRVGRLAVELLLVGVDERLHLGALLVGRVVIREEAAVDRAAADLQRLLAVPTVAADQRHGDPEL